MTVWIAIWLYLVGLGTVFHAMRVLDIKRDRVSITMAFLWPITEPVVWVYGFFKYGYEDTPDD